MHGTDGCVQLPRGPVRSAASRVQLQIQQLVELQFHGSRRTLCRLRGAAIAGDGNPQFRPIGREALNTAFMYIALLNRYTAIMHIHSLTYTHTYTHSHSHTYTYTHTTHTFTHTFTHTCTHTCTHTFIHTNMNSSAM